MQFSSALIAFMATLAIASPVEIAPRGAGDLVETACKLACDVTCNRVPSFLRGVCKKGCKALCDAAAEEGEEFNPAEMIEDAPITEKRDVETEIVARGGGDIVNTACKIACDVTCSRVPSFLRGVCKKGCKALCDAAAEEGQEFNPETDLIADAPVAEKRDVEEAEIVARGGGDLVNTACKLACDVTCNRVPSFLRGVCKKGCKALCDAAAEEGEEFHPETDLIADA